MSLKDVGFYFYCSTKLSSLLLNHAYNTLVTLLPEVSQALSSWFCCLYLVKVT